MSEKYIDADDVVRELELKGGLATLKRMARRREFPELLHVTHGQYRVRRSDYEAWEQARMTSAEMAREELQAVRDREALQ